MKNINEISYTLSKQVPAMLRGFAIQTNYGDLWIDAKGEMKPIYISTHYLQIIIRWRSRMAVIGSPTPLVGGWLTMKPKLGASNGN